MYNNIISSVMIIVTHSCTIDEVEFEVGTDTRTNKLIARRLVKLPTGTVSFESISEGRLLGKVDCEPKMIAGANSTEANSKGNRVSTCTALH